MRTESYEAKNMGPRLRVIQSDRQRIALLEDLDGWNPIIGKLRAYQG
jgi:hypothetical protein